MEPNTVANGINKHFGTIEDPRIERCKRHKLLDILVIAICASICGADSWGGVETFGQAKQAWFKLFLELPNGIPSHDTFNRVFNHLDSAQFQHSFISWINEASQRIGGQVIAIDGKVLRRSHDHGIGKGAIDMVSAWATANHLVLGQVKVAEKSNEITAIPQLLQALEIAGCIITIDAMGCQTEIAKEIIKQDAEYVLSLKGNQGTLFDDVKLMFDDLDNRLAYDIKYKTYAYDYHKTTNQGHGRLEIRECWTISDRTILDNLHSVKGWKNLSTIVRIRAQRLIGEKKSCEDRYYIASIMGAKQILSVVRSHWRIENELHWCLDVAFNEDQCRIRKGQGAENFAILRHIALNLLKHEKTCKRGIKGKRLLAGWDESYLAKVLNGFSSLNL